ncbi:C-terminal binding protein [Chloroflexota bacterium]
MTTLKVIRADKEGASVNLDLETSELKKVGAQLVGVNASTEGEIISAAKDADGIITSKALITAKIIKALPKLKVIVRLGVGYDNIDINAATDEGVIVAYIPDYCYEEVSNHAIALLLACNRKLVMQNGLLKTGQWKEAQQSLPPMGTIYGDTLGIIGTGNIGRRTGGKAQAFGLKVIGYDPYVDKTIVQPYGITLTDFSTVLCESDYLSIHVPLNDETRHMIGNEQLAQMKPNAYLINTARGKVVDQVALTKALCEKTIAGAALDVFDKEPLDPDNPLLKMDNVICTPHSAFFSDASTVKQRMKAGEESARVLSGRWPKNIANKGVKPRVPLIIGD